MSDLKAIRAAQIKAAEEAAIAGIPKPIMDRMNEAQAAFVARGGCKGCGSMVLAVHGGNCPTLADDLY